ncbi:superoxide dismutase [Ehrlichia ruminantium]|nr:superoxide dismutase [Ehrlichia ruminantium]ABG37824.1 Fe superoxide dismutase [Ehrlichia ruminantium]ABG37825.1 Fe superoxide dismutase [Ehrlichia ruminantium]ABG37826.1 Fe superoxide dismutase [Ehrlichia ruminantium]ABG37827.1 Fe superoxide dismutase [Ehrlichia ruminantium]ABG37829.1 Fe superoxide dismutase [Ehrlichia ruminantium]
MFTLPELPYQKDDLAPYLSANVLNYHYGKHHQGYVNALNNLVAGTDFCTCTNEDLPAVIKATHSDLATRSIFNNAGQVWNHNFYWQSITKNGVVTPKGELLDRINKDFESVEKFNNAFTEAGKGHFGSGWVWLVFDTVEQKLKILCTANGDTPITQYPDTYPLLTMDVWEHAYYLDYFNVRQNYIEIFLKHLVNWDFASQRFSQCIDNVK